MSSADAEAADVGPTLGTMFRLIHSAMLQEYSRWLASTEYDDFKPAYAAIMQPLWAAKQGERLTTLAAIASITKQSAGALVDALLAGGYVERVPDPEDGRAMRIRLAARGRRYGRDVRRFSREFEARIAGKVGARRLKQLRADLDLLLDALHEAD
jgi:DNA-binding MarR family transcriptional regulator